MASVSYWCDMFDTNLLPANEILTFCQQLIQTSSVNGENDELAAAELIADFAAGFGFETELVALEPRRPSALVRLGPPGEAGLLLVGHIDTVPAGSTASWKHPPFSGHIEGNRLYGRGAIDNKGGIVSALAAMILLQQQAAGGLKRPVLLACVPDEESGASGRLGIRHLHSLGKLSGRGAIYTYPVMTDVEIGHRGVLRLEIETGGTSMHTGSAAWQNSDRSANAVTGMADILLAFENLPFPAEPAGSAFTEYRTVITPTIISGGSGPSMAPDTCRALVDIRLVPSIPREQVEAAVAGVLQDIQRRRPALTANCKTLVYLPSTLIPQDSAIIRAVKEATRAVLGQQANITVAGPANESYLLNDYGIPTVTCGPEGEGAHSANEYVLIDSIFQAAEVYARVALQLAED